MLVVDDSADLQELYELMLDSAGYSVTHALDGEAGLRVLDHESPDVVLLDMMMPELDGLGFLDRMYRECPSPWPPVIACSGFAGYRDAALAHGAIAFLEKPTDVDLLLRTIGVAIAKTPVPPEALDSNGRRMEGLRAAAEAATAEAVARLDVRGLDPLRPWMRALTVWLARWYGFGTVFLHLLRGKALDVEATHGDEPFLVEGMSGDRLANYCNEVLSCGSTLVISDALSHPARHFSEHPTLRRRGYRFYLGSPLATPAGIVLGTLCMAAPEPHDVHVEDVQFVGVLAREIARAFAAHGADQPVVAPIDANGLWASPMLRRILEVTLRRFARTGGSVHLASFTPPDADILETLVRYGYQVGGGHGTAFALRASEKVLLILGAHERDAARNAFDAIIAAARVLGVEPDARTSWSPVGPRTEVDTEAVTAALLADVE